MQKKNPTGKGSSTDKNGTSSVNEPAIAISRGMIKEMEITELFPSEVIQEGDDEFLLIERTLEDFYPDSTEIAEKFPGALKAFTPKSRSANTHIKLSDLSPAELLFLDIETCGLQNVPLFLIGIAYFNGESFDFLQLFARSYEEEKPLLSFFHRFVKKYPVLVTYNGKSFDIPFINARNYANRVQPLEDKPNLDLLFEVRRQWSGILPNCKLQTVEKNILERQRKDDIPGYEIPLAYNEYIQSGEPVEINKVIDHNLFDIVALIEILVKFEHKR